MSDPDVTRMLLVCGAMEAIAWGLAWFFGWSPLSLVFAIGVSLAVSGVIVVVLQRRQRERKGG